MPAELERKLKRQAKKKKLGKKRTNAYVYGTMNELGLMHGNKRTRKKVHTTVHSVRSFPY